MKFLMIVIFTNSGFTAEFNNELACAYAANTVMTVQVKSMAYCVPKGKTDLNKMNDSLYEATKELFNGD